MKGIYFEKIFVTQLLVLIIVYTVISILDFFGKKIVDRRDGNLNKDNKKKIKNIIKVIVYITMAFIAVYGFVKCENLIIYGVSLIVATMICVVAYIVAIYEFIQYIFLKPFDYKLTKQREETLWVVGSLVYCGCEIISADVIKEPFNLWVNKLEDYQADIIKMTLIPLWYFVIIFFSLVFFTLFLHKIIIWIKGEKREKQCVEKVGEVHKRHKKKSWADKLWYRIESRPKRCKWKKKIYYFGMYVVLVIVLLGESLKELGINIFKIVRKLAKLLIYLPLMYIKKGVRYVVALLEKEQGKVIVLGSRIALVSSLLIVFWIDNYENIFSDYGSPVFEFFCSVIIIPYFITQFNELQNLKKSNEAEPSV